MSEENIKILWDKINCEACWNKDISTCFECKNQCIEFKALKEIVEEKGNLIKYLEDFISKTDNEVNIKGNYLYLAWSNAYKALLERVKSGKYE